jgi:iron complex outermembrane receptor protein
MVSLAATPARALRALRALLVLPIVFGFTLRAGAQVVTRDSLRADTTRAQRLERVTVSAVRASNDAPVSRKTLGEKDIAPRYFGQDVPLLLQGPAPSLTSYAETGNYWGYSYIRLRGIDQSRINLTLDGIPLNDPEDQVLYFADFPDLANSLGSVQIQRGVGTSTNGTAAYAGSINMESVPLGVAALSGNIQAERGSFGSRRYSAEYQSGLMPTRFAWYGRVSSLHTDGYRYHSGVEGKSAFFSAGYFGDRDILKATVVTGTMRDTMAYLAVPVTDLDTNRRLNPLTPRERDGFTERLAALSYTHELTPAATWSTTAYRISAGGDYDVQLDSLQQFNLDFVWYGATSTFTVQGRGVRFDAGLNGNTYSRDHFAFQHPDLDNPLYFNTGHKQDASGFAKIAYTAGAATLFGDLQARYARFRYTPDAHAGIAERSVDWTFVNPKVGLSYTLSKALSIYGSLGANTREPARSDMFAGFDNLDTSNASFVGDLRRVKPEHVRDLEAGTMFHSSALDLQADVYDMRFHDEITPIGALSYIGTPLRKNVGSSYRRGVEADLTVRAIPRTLLSGNVTLSRNRIQNFVDSTGETPVIYRDVEPLLTPRATAYGRAAFAASQYVWLAADVRYAGESFLQNNGDPRFILPAATTLDLSASLHERGVEFVFRANNVTNSRKYGSGYASGDVPAYYVLPPRNLFVTAKIGM